MRTFSFGAGVQSTAVLVLQAEGRLPEPYDTFLFANVGDDSEHPATIKYFRNVHLSYAEAHGIQLEETRRVTRDGTTPTLLEWTLQASADRGKTMIPVFIAGGGPGFRGCTGAYKRDVIWKWQRERGASKDDPAVCGLGISVDEIERARTSSKFSGQILQYPLIDLGLNRRDCHQIIKDAGLPPAPKSACWFCPFHDRESWRRLKREHPDVFAQAAELEQTLSDDSQRHGGLAKWFTKAGRPLDQVVDDQLVLDIGGPDGCDSGSCFT